MFRKGVFLAERQPLEQTSVFGGGSLRFENERWTKFWLIVQNLGWFKLEM